MKNAWIKKVLNQEMKLATGCTEPGAIALCAAYVGEKVTEEICSVQVNCSVNIIKNAMSACIPNMNPKGVDVAAAIGLVLRVVKNVMEAAVELKTENDLTV